MADSLEDLGGKDIFPLEPNWATRPRLDLEFSRTLIKYPGSVSQLKPLTDDAPERWEFGFTPDKSDEYDLIDFFVGKYGRHGGFWMKIPSREFTLYQDSLSGSTEIRAELNNAERQYQGYERIWIDMHNGEILTRNVDDATNEGSYIALSIATQLDRDLLLTNHYKICRLIYCRFDEDAMILDYSQDQYPQIRLLVRELVKEYPA
jgi:hypothetical protein